MRNEHMYEIIEFLEKSKNNKSLIFPRKWYFINNAGYKFVPIEYLGNFQFKVRFLDTQYEKICYYHNMLNGKVYDPLSTTIYGLACFGEKQYHNRMTDPELNRRLYNSWLGMIRRCYDKKHRSYRIYGEMGIRVCDRWLNFSNYFDDVQLLEGYNRDLILAHKLDLDKDIIQHNLEKENMIYSPSTCKWVTRSENVLEYINKNKERNS